MKTATSQDLYAILRYPTGIYAERERAMNKQFTASEVRELAKYMESVGWRPDSKGDPECYDEGAARSAEILFAFADLLEEREKAMPVATVVDQFGFPLMEWIGDAGDRCPVGTKLYTHRAPSDAERLADRRDDAFSK